MPIPTYTATNNFHLGDDIAIDWRMIAPNRRDVHYKFLVHYHPYTDALIEKLNSQGLEAMLDVNYHASLVQPLTDYYIPGPWTYTPFPQEDIDVTDDGPYANYNWEIFFHAPLTIAVHLSKNQRFAEAQKWFHYIFDPTSNDKTVDPPERFWKFLRFRQETNPEFINDLLTALAQGTDPVLKARMEKAIQAWRDKPFQPHVIARTRYLAYQINVVMKYLDNLIAWGDNLFRQDTIETTNEATQIYVLAANILGEKPQRIPPRGKVTPKTYKQLKDAGIDAFGNALVDIENDFPFNSIPGTGGPTNPGGTAAAFGIGRSLYFCIPQNDKLLSYWDIVDDRLYKLRHCMNIEGIVRQLPLFDPPIDPGMLVKAAAAGIDIGSIVNSINQPLSTVRGPLLLQKAMEICNEVKSLGGALLAALEKGDGERLALLRQQHEMNLLHLAQDVKFLQWKEAENSTASLVRSRQVVWERYRHYKMILGTNESDINALKSIDLVRSELNEANFDEAYNAMIGTYINELASEPYRKETSVGGLMEFAGRTVAGIFGGQLGKTLPLNKNENAELNIFLPASDTFNKASMALRIAAPILALIPQFHGHVTPLGVGAAVGFGGQQLSKAAKGASDITKQIADVFASSAERASRMGGYYRRAEDYVLQANIATSELASYGRQIIGALIREQITKKDYLNHLKQIEQSQQVMDFYRDKFTNEELYTWMQGEISKIYFSSYQFAYDIAKRSEQTMKHELMRPEFDSQDFIKFGYWDNSRKGLLSGEALSLDLKRLEMAYHDNNRREYEITKHVSLHRLDPMALLKLKATGSCEVDVPEWLYDLDSPGHFMRRIKTVALSIPCITGPFTGVHCRLSLLQSSLRISSLAGDKYERDGSDDLRFRDYNGAIQSVVTSTAQNDSGMFEVNLKDERYLPFEGAGAISRWKIELPSDIPPFDFETISDVILHIRYTAREAGHLRAEASKFIKEKVFGDASANPVQLYTLNNDFPNEWNLFVQAPNDTVRQLNITLDKNYFPYWVNPLDMDDTVKAQFCAIEWDKHRLVICTQDIILSGGADIGWTLGITNGNTTIFNFLKNHKDTKVYMALSFAGL